MTARLLLVLLALTACARWWEPSTQVAPPDDSEPLVRLAERRAQAGAYAEAARLFEDVLHRPGSAFTDRALLGLTRVLVNPEYSGRDYRQAFVAADRLVREYPGSPYAGEVRAWRELLGAYLARTEELERLKRLDLELEQRQRKP